MLLSFWLLKAICVLVDSAAAEAGLTHICSRMCFTTRASSLCCECWESASTYWTAAMVTCVLLIVYLNQSKSVFISFVLVRHFLSHLFSDDHLLLLTRLLVDLLQLLRRFPCQFAVASQLKHHQRLDQTLLSLVPTPADQQQSADHFQCFGETDAVVSIDSALDLSDFP